MATEGSTNGLAFGIAMRSTIHPGGWSHLSRRSPRWLAAFALSICIATPVFSQEPSAEADLATARDAMAAAIQGMLNGQATPEEVMAAAQEAKERAQQ